MNQQQPSTLEAALARIAELEAKNQPRGELSVSPKGYVLFQPKGRKGWPMALKMSDFAQIFANEAVIKAFIQDHAEKLTK